MSKSMKATKTLLFCFVLAQFFACTEKQLTLVNNNSTDYTILVPLDAEDEELKAARELQTYLLQMSGVSLPVLKESGDVRSKTILLGKTNASSFLAPKKDEIVISSQEQNLYILGGDPKSTLYATYTFLEDFLGCRFYTPNAEVIPKQKLISIPSTTNFRYVPPITTRTVHSRLYYEDHQFADKRKTTYEAFPRYVPSAGVHTFHRFLPADRYLRKHPEYFALRTGKRIPTQLCLSNENVLKIVIDVVDSLLKKYPESDVISVSQDDNTQYCQCDNCAKIDNREGSPSGSVIEFVNKVAQKFPDKTISTLAYQYTRTAPKQIRPEENVLITLCSIECDRSAPIAEKCKDFADDLAAWGKLTENIRIWDYTTQFTNYLAPFPNIHTLQPNIHLFVDNNAKWVFEQHSNQPSELFELRSYLTAKLLWDPFADQDAIIEDFLDGYYEEGAPFVQNYITTIHSEIQKTDDFFLFLYGDPSQGFSSFLRPELLAQYDLWYDEASKAIGDKPDVLKRLNRARLSVDYAILEAARINRPGSFSLVETKDDGSTAVTADVIERLDRFRKTCEEANITNMNEMRYSVAEYLEAYQHTVSRAKKENIAKGKQVKLLTSPKKYANEDPQVLTDGAFGGANFYANWLGFEGNDLEAVIDLESDKKLQYIGSDFLQVVNHVVFFPTDVKYYYSLDGENYTLLGTVRNERPLSKQSKINDIQSFEVEFLPVMARYIKIKANNMDIAPDWHHAAGLPAWIFIDEVLVR